MAAFWGEAERLEVPVHRVSQGSGVMMLTDAEICDMVSLGAARGVELSLFLGPRGTWDIGAAARSPSGGPVGAGGEGSTRWDSAWRTLTAPPRSAFATCSLPTRACCGRSTSNASPGDLPADMRFKISVLIGPVNPVSFRVIAALGADSINVHSDLTVAQLAEIRAASSAALDMYVESPDDIGGFVRLYEAAALIRVAAPIYLKFGLRNAPGIYPFGEHLRDVAAATDQTAYGALDSPSTSSNAAAALRCPCRRLAIRRCLCLSGSVRAEQETEPVAHHGEGAVWDERLERILWVDLLRGDVLSTAPGSGVVDRRHVGIGGCMRRAAHGQRPPGRGPSGATRSWTPTSSGCPTSGTTRASE